MRIASTSWRGCWGGARSRRRRARMRRSFTSSIAVATAANSRFVRSERRTSEAVNPHVDARVAGLEIALMFMGSTLLTPLYVIYQRAFGFTEITLTLVYAVYV